MLAAAALAGTLLGPAPIVVQDSRERSPLSAVAGPAVPAPVGRPPAVYTRRTPTRDGAWVQHWMFYPRQDQDRGIVRTGRHEGDWEMVQYRFDHEGRPVEAVYAQHAGAERCAWSAVERRDGRPVVYAARGSHASYFRSGIRDRQWPEPNDEADGRGREIRPRVVRITASSPQWMTWPAPWGGARARSWIPGEEDSPRGPAFQPERWDDPAAWAAAAVTCRAACDAVDECDDGEAALGFVAAVIGVLAAGLRVGRRPRDGGHVGA